MRRIVASVFALCLLSPVAFAQVLAGSPEDKMVRRIAAENVAETKLAIVTEFERQFPRSRALPEVYMMAIEVYREKNDRANIIEFGEKILKVDDGNVTALMVLARNYAMGGKNLDRAVELAKRAVDRIETMKTQQAPPQLTESQWKEYLARTDGAARGIFDYAKALSDAAHQ